MYKTRKKIKENPILKLRLLIGTTLLLILTIGLTTYFTTYSDRILKFNDDPDYLERSIKDNKVIINEIEKDYNYYEGLNYTESDGTLPTTENKNLYNDTNLVQVKLTYKSDDGTNKGYVSLTERQDTYIYFNVIEVNNNNTEDQSDDYIKIKLIDNPFTNRPKEKGFNGWFTDNEKATISFDKDYYQRYVTIPITYQDGKPEKVELTLTAKWIEAKIINVGSNFNTAIQRLNSEGMKAVEKIKITYKDIDMTGYYYQVILSDGDSLAGLYNNRGQIQNGGTCSTRWGRTCTYYQKIQNENFDENQTYYQLSGGRMNQLDNSTIQREILSEEENPDLIGNNMATYYESITIPYRSSIVGYYNNLGQYQQTGTCTTQGGCTYYQLLQYYNSNGEEEIYDNTRNYYYLVTRDTNILVLNKNISGSWSSTSIPFTITSLNNNQKNNVTWNATSAINAYSDLTIENVTLYYEEVITETSDAPTREGESGVLYGNYHNVKIGRGLTQYNNYPTLKSVLGGNLSATGSNNTPTKYTFILESGKYNSISLSTGGILSNTWWDTSPTLYLKTKGIYGNDYDKANKNNTNLDIYFCASGSWGGKIYATTSQTTTNDISLDLTVKSGTFGSSKADLATGIYVGGRYGGTHSSARRAKIEGGYIYNLIGGPLTNQDRKNVNDIYINMIGGEIDIIIGGAGTTATYGNRVISVTGGTVNYSLFGGSNGFNGNSGDGTLNGTPYIYVGGDATIGNDNAIKDTNPPFNVEAGSIFGIGNGNSTASSIGSCDNSIIIIDGKATIKKNIYGGGNYGAVGVSSSSSTAYSTIIIKNGFIEGSVYGGGNKNGSGNNSKSSTVNITMNDGNVVGSIYGGSNEEGIIYGDVNINILGGEITTSIYGGGRGGTTSSTGGTFVKGEINIQVGDESTNKTPIINNGVYGGSAFGTVNGETINATTTDKTKVTVNKGIITNVFGGGEGNTTYTPHVLGDIEVTINNGNITNVYGGNDQSGKPSGNITVTINNGTITNTFGGGNETGADQTNVFLNNGTVTKIFGGSNNSGDVTESNVTATGGVCTTIYGGNNVGGTTGTTNVLIEGGDITTVYGGGDQTSVQNSTNVTINNNVNTIFGGSNLSGDIPITNIEINNANINEVYGGNNLGGKVESTNTIVNGLYIDSIYGGGLKAETTETNLTLNYGLINNVYGGGNEAGADITNLNLGGGTIQNLFGGSNTSGNVTTTNIQNNQNINTNIKVETTIKKSTINQTGATNIKGSETIGVTITNNSGKPLPTWDLYLLTTDSIFDSNWSSTKVEFQEENSIYHIDETNQWYGTNPLNSGSEHTFEFNIHSYDTFEEFKILGYLLVAKDTSNNQYQTKLNIDKAYGGNNLGGEVSTSNINLTSGIINTLYGGGKKATTTNAITSIQDVIINNSIYGGGDEADVKSVTLNINTSEVGTQSEGQVYGGGAFAKVTDSLALNITESKINGDTYGGGNKGPVTTEAKSTITNSTITNIYGGGNASSVKSSNITIEGATKVTSSIYGGGNLGEVEEDTTITINEDATINNLFGGGNASAVKGSTNININGSTITNIYGGGNGSTSIVPGDQTGEQNPAKVYKDTNITIDNNAIIDNIYGGGNLGMVNQNTNVTTKEITINDSIYGGGASAIVGGNTNLYTSNTTTNGSIYAGGNGQTAIVYGNTNLNIDNNTKVGKHVFGGGNAAATGKEEENTSQGIVNIVGATINGNVYGGANTSRLYGETTVNIGQTASSNKNLIPSDIIISGTIFGGGEANASGSEEYDYSFISVTKGINININGENHNTFTIGGSIFGSGNASSTTGYSYIHINNYGTKEDIKRNISIQRANIVTIDNSNIELKGATDRTNEYSTVLFSLSRIDELKLSGNTSLYLENSANLVKKLSSITNETTEEKAKVTIDTETNTYTRNINNRLYMLEGKNLNIATNENITSFGEVSGMTFFGMYLLNRNNEIITALYNDYTKEDNVSSGDIYYFTKGSYVLGMHKQNHDITKDGFYTNYGNEEATGIIINYIEPTPDNADFYMWTIGEKVDSYELTLTASKYSTLGTYELSLLNHASANTTFSTLGVNYSSLNEDIKLIDYSSIPRVAATEEEANTIFGLNLKAGQTGWITKGNTSFITEGDTNITGTTSYQRENTSEAPGLVFYFYHSKNLTKTQNLGSVTISLVAITPIDDLNSEVKRININVNLNTAMYNTNDYEGTIAPGKQHEMFATSSVDITTKSSFSTYYSLYIDSKTTPYKEGYHRSIVSTYLFPVNTEITMIDFHVEDKPVYYYYVVTKEDYITQSEEYSKYSEVSYNLSKFVKMGSTSPNNNYNDAQANITYYKDQKAIEEFIFMIDFKDTTIEEDILDKSLLIELRNSDEQTLISVLGIEQATMKYDIYANKEGLLKLSGELNSDTIYRGKELNLTLDTNFIQDKVSTDTIFDTNYNEQKLGIKITIQDSHGTPLTSSSLMGLNYTIDGKIYYPRYDGTVRINIAEKIANTRTKITINTAGTNLSTGEYTLVIESFGSPDGIYYGLTSSDKLELNFSIKDNIYGLKITTPEDEMYIDKETGTIGENNAYVYTIDYESGLTNPNIRIKLQRRDYSTIYTSNYEDYDIKDYITNTLESTTNPKEYYLIKNPPNTITNFLYFKENLPDGTYKIIISLYDNDNYIGEVYQYIIIK